MTANPRSSPWTNSRPFGSALTFLAKNGRAICMNSSVACRRAAMFAYRGREVTPRSERGPARPVVVGDNRMAVVDGSQRCVLKLAVFIEHKFVYRTSARPWPLPRRAGVCALAVVVLALLFAAQPRAQFEKPVSTTFDGWRQQSDGSFDLVFGYMNRNASAVDVPLGPANAVDPAPADQGQPTTFLPG